MIHSCEDNLNATPTQEGLKAPVVEQAGETSPLGPSPQLFGVHVSPSSVTPAPY